MIKIPKLFLIFSLLSTPIFAESILCVPNLGAGIFKDGNQGVNMDVSFAKFLLNKKNGSWSLAYIGYDGMDVPCSTSMLCQCTHDWCGSFIRDQSNGFHYFYMTGEPVAAVVLRGKCSRIN